MATMTDDHTRAGAQLIEQIIDTYSPVTEAEAVAVPEAVRELLDRILANAVATGDAVEQSKVHDELNRLIAELEAKLQAQSQAIARRPKFKKLKAAWLGIIRAHEQTADGEFDLDLWPMTASERRADLRKGRRAELVKTIGGEFNTYGGQPYSIVGVDDEFAHDQASVSELKAWGRLGIDHHLAVFAGVAPRLFGAPSFGEMADDPEVLTAAMNGMAYAQWRDLQKTDEAMCIGLALPRVLAEPPHGPANPAAGLPFFTDAVATDDDLVWMNAMYLLFGRFGAALRDTGFCLRTSGIRNGGVVDSLPVCDFPTDPSRTPRPPVEIQLEDRLEFFCGEKLRLIPLYAEKNGSTAVFFGVNSLQLPAKTQDTEQTAGAVTRSSLAVKVSNDRLAHHLKLLCREMVGDQAEEDDVEAELNLWLSDFCLANHKNASRSQRAIRPLRKAVAEVKSLNGATGFYEAKLTLTYPKTLKGVVGEFVIRATPSKQ